MSVEQKPERYFIWENPVGGNLHTLEYTEEAGQKLEAVAKGYLDSLVYTLIKYPRLLMEPSIIQGVLVQEEFNRREDRFDSGFKALVDGEIKRSGSWYGGTIGFEARWLSANLVAGFKKYLPKIEDYPQLDTHVALAARRVLMHGMKVTKEKGNYCDGNRNYDQGWLSDLYMHAMIPEYSDKLGIFVKGPPVKLPEVRKDMDIVFPGNIVEELIYGRY